MRRSFWLMLVSIFLILLKLGGVFDGFLMLSLEYNIGERIWVRQKLLRFHVSKAVHWIISWHYFLVLIHYAWAIRSVTCAFVLCLSSCQNGFILIINFGIGLRTWQMSGVYFVGHVGFRFINSLESFHGTLSDRREGSRLITLLFWRYLLWLGYVFLVVELLVLVFAVVLMEYLTLASVFVVLLFSR